MRLLTATASAMLALSLTGCGDGDDDTEADSSDSPSSSVGSSNVPSTDGDARPCDLVSAADVETAYGVTVGEGEPGLGGHNENDVKFSSSDCDWQAEDHLEVELALSRAADFEGGLTCIPVRYLGQDGAPVDVAGASSATWLASEDPDEVEAQLRACTDSAVLTFSVEAKNGSDVAQLRTSTITVAEKALAGLG
ncbi:hypothetical protein [Nocardioides jensenii]|uniref:hypothetical protein n=1 Tax=Nocardioides jensenii TaxID=1843 RepID=UPI00082F0356|nr:hypothetical protein [Nocardioides jensenii]